jgi:3-deoxy-D-manno-octulosonic-acid transferase
VGETIAVKPLLAALKKSYPHRPLIVSNMTETGRAVAEALPGVDFCLYFPFDYPFAVKRILDRVRPALVVIVETELWPNFLRQAHARNIPTLVVNGRISDRSFGRYLGLSWFFRPILTQVDRFCMQSSEDARRIRAIGALPGQVAVTRNLKFDIAVQGVSSGERQAIMTAYRLPAGVQIITAGSTHPGEEELVIEAFARVTAQQARTFLVLVPRHPERAGAVAQLLRQAGLPHVRRTALEGGSELPVAGGVLLVDTIGELMRFYGVADLVFVGGSLVPVGGHNVLEPASLGVPVLFGPHMTNFREIAAMTLSYGAARQVADGEELAGAFGELLADAALRSAMGENGCRLLSEQGGATELNMAVINELVSPEGVGAG